MKGLSRTIVVLVVVLSACEGPKSKVVIASPQKTAYIKDPLTLTKQVYYDKVLGALVGSAIGDAMGASTEMWHRNDIRLRYGYITDLTPAIREKSPEGTWEHNLMAGATTDDTRWKLFMAHYFKAYPRELSPGHFASFITQYYRSVVNALAKEDILAQPDSLDVRMGKVNWIKEWARVALAYKDGPEAYQEAVNRFYGGEMSCAGQLYTPMFGLWAQSPGQAYDLAYGHSLFDLGYAKDISALVAVMTHMALRTQDMDSVLRTTVFVDPLGYKNSRLVGRISQNITDTALLNVLQIGKKQIVPDSLMAKDSLSFRVPPGFLGSDADWIRQEMNYQTLEKDSRATAFHAGEIWQILVTALQFGQGDFEKTLQFIVNYGRDNDTVAAIAGTILGALHGYYGLPTGLRKEILRVNREFLGIDLETLAQEIVDAHPNY
ncbi:MAG: ADP-ribosylglycohydrolase family protein [Bacteroidota bacterium]